MKQNGLNLKSCLFLFVALLVWPSEVRADWLAQQVVILANEKSDESLSIAKYYAQRRGIPDRQIILLDVPLGETISFEEYEESVVNPVREALKAKHLTGQTRILVTTYGIPLRLRAPQPTEQERLWLKDAGEWQEGAEHYLEELEAHIHQIADQPAEGGQHSLPSQKGSDVIQRIQKALAQAQSRLTTVGREKKEAARQAFGKMALQIRGLSAQIAYASFFSTDLGERGRQRNAALQQEISNIQRVLAVLSTMPSTKTRERAYEFVQQYFGLVGVLQMARQEMRRFSYKNGRSSLDSELSLLWWDRSMYPVSGRFPNPFYAWSSPTDQTQHVDMPIMLVSRLDAPTAMLVKSMIDQALMIEQTGLAGTVYLDARGQKPGAPLSYGYYDQSLRDLAKIMDEITTYPIRLDNTPRRFSQPGEAPNVALYVGWYRLRAYEDAFTFNPGAIGYHIASGEAVSIHNPHERGWCKNALERGIAVTLGPVNEPYLDAFPLPTEFVGLLLTGRYSLVEAYYLSSRYVSWQMVLFGDPLYIPWGGRGLENKVLASGMLKKDRLPQRLSTRPMIDPLVLRQRLHRQQQQLLTQLALAS